MKVYMDIITNHTADVIQFRECQVAGQSCDYRTRADYPYQRQGGPSGAPINPGFAGDEAKNQTAENFARLVDPNYAYSRVRAARRTGCEAPGLAQRSDLLPQSR